MEPAEALVTPVCLQSVAPLYDAYVAEDYLTETSAHGMQEPIRLHSSVSSRRIPLFRINLISCTVAGGRSGFM